MILEACVETFEQAVLAEKRGAHRIELCADLHLDGLTPDFKLVRKTASFLNIPVMVMIRPREGNFIYSDEEIAQMINQIQNAKNSGAAGVVIGLLKEGNQIDSRNTRLLSESANPLPVTFHKAIDQIPDPAEGVRMLKEIQGITRILTSGGSPTAMDGHEKIREMIECAGDELIILVAGKVTYLNLKDIQRVTGAEEFHGRKIVCDIN